MRDIKKQTGEIFINEKHYKVNIFYENRNNSRVSITKTGVNIRIPKQLVKHEQEAQIARFIAWAKQTITEKEISFEAIQNEFKDGDVLKLYDAEIAIEIQEVKSNVISGKLNEKKLCLKIPENLDAELKAANISKLMSKLVAKSYKARIVNKLLSFNEKFKLGTINQVRLKNNSTNWGSCSSKNNINVSVRLLLAPEFAVDYVLIHELCHLKHRNHSRDFWNLVASCCPEYMKAEEWLKKNSSKCVL